MNSLHSSLKTFDQWDKESHYERCHGLQRDSARKAWDACAKEHEARIEELSEKLSRKENALENETRIRQDYVKRTVKLEEKLKVAMSALTYGSGTLAWYRTRFQGEQHEFEHFWRVELPHEIDEALLKIQSGEEENG